jgi:transposase
MLVHTPHGPLDVDIDTFELPPTFPVVLPICRALDISRIVDQLCPMRRSDHVSHGQVVEFLCLHLLQSPARLPLYKLAGWAAEHNVDQLYGCEAEAFNDDRVRRALEALAPRISEIEARVVANALRHYRVPVRAIHWDLTHVTFSGLHEGSKMVCSGYGDGQLHDRQVHISLHVTAEHGIPLRHETLAGSSQQAPLAESILSDLKERLPGSDLIIVSDCSGISYDNIAVYEQAKAHFLAPLQLTPKERQELAAAPAECFVALDYKSRSEPQCIYSCYDTQLTIQRQKRTRPQAVRALFIHSTSKHKRDTQQRQALLDKLIAKLTKVQSSLNKNRYSRFTYALEQIDKHFPAELRGIVSYDLRGADKQLQLRFVVDREALDQAAQADGRYLLITNLTQPTAHELFLMYKGQAGIEARFRHLNSNLSVHPLWLQSDNRIEALLAVFVLALIVYSILGLCADRAQIPGDQYHKMTATQIIYHFSTVKIAQLTIPGQTPQAEFKLTDDQRYILAQLDFPDPTQYLISRPKPCPDG